MRFRLVAGFVGFVLLGAVSVEAQERDYIRVLGHQWKR